MTDAMSIEARNSVVSNRGNNQKGEMTVRTNEDKEHNNCYNRVYDFLPGLEHDSALVLVPLLVLDFASVENLLARVRKVVEEARRDGGGEYEKPCACRVELHQSVLAEACSDESKM